MSFANLGSHWWVILIIVVLLFGAPKLPALARSMGQSMRIFKNEIKTKDDDGTAASAAAPVPPTYSAPAPAAPAPAASRAEQNEPGDTASKP
jgi:sec-independent protein translocase protein TatA